MPLDVAAYYYPGFHADPRTSAWHGAGWSEWDLLKAARPRYAGHEQPRVPAWGHFDESDPRWAERQIHAAAAHGISAFIFDWYWYDGQPFLEGALRSGFLAAANADEMKFAVMWANHDWLDIHPAAAGRPPRTLLSAATTPSEFDALADRVVADFFSRANYLRLDGAPYFSIYNLRNFVAAMGSVPAAAAALRRLRDTARAAGEPDVHVNVVLFDLPVIPGESAVADRAEMIKALEVSSVGSYVWVHHYPPGRDGFPCGSYLRAFEANAALWPRFRAEFSVPYFPNVTVGWDPSPRTTQDQPFREGAYPWGAALAGSTPERFETALRAARRFAAEQSGPQLLTLNAWNEWTEGSYLLPDTRHGDGYLAATQRAVGDLVRADGEAAPDD